MTDTELDRLTAIAHAARPDWPQASIRTFLAKRFTGYSYRDIALVLINVATAEPRTDTPRLMLQAAPWTITALALGGTEPTPIPPAFDRTAAAQARAHRTSSEDAGEQITAARRALHQPR